MQGWTQREMHLMALALDLKTVVLNGQRD